MVGAGNLAERVEYTVSAEGVPNPCYIPASSYPRSLEMTQEFEAPDISEGAGKM